MMFILAFFGAMLLSQFAVNTTFDALGWQGFEVTCGQDAAGMEHCDSWRGVCTMLLTVAVMFVAIQVDERSKR